MQTSPRTWHAPIDEGRQAEPERVTSEEPSLDAAMVARRARGPAIGAAGEESRSAAIRH